jgi:hypothetical protein
MYKKDRLKQFDNYDDIRKELLTPEQIKQQDKEVSEELAALKSLQETVTRMVAHYMADEDIGIVELTSRLETSSKQTNKIMKAEANLTLATIAEISAKMGYLPKISFEKKLRQN